MNTSTSFEHLNMSITLLYTSCAVGTLPLGLFITSDELVEKAINLLKMILPEYAFIRCGLQVGLMVFFTDDSSAECNSLKMYLLQGVYIYNFEILLSSKFQVSNIY